MSARRVSLTDLADRQEPIVAPPITEITSSGFDTNGHATPVGETPEVEAPSEITESKPTTGTDSTRSRRRNPPSSPSADRIRRRFDEYERKETRLRDDQYGRLTTTSRRLNRTRRGEGDRITENTLIRVAIDLLFAKEDLLEGKSETELRRSVGL